MNGPADLLKMNGFLIDRGSHNHKSHHGLIELREMKAYSIVNLSTQAVSFNRAFEYFFTDTDRK